MEVVLGQWSLQRHVVLSLVLLIPDLDRGRCEVWTWCHRVISQVGKVCQKLLRGCRLQALTTVSEGLIESCYFFGFKYIFLDIIRS